MNSALKEISFVFGAFCGFSKATSFQFIWLYVHDIHDVRQLASKSDPHFNIHLEDSFI